MIKIEAVTLEAAYKDASLELKCSVTELKIEIVQAPSKGFLGFFKKPAIIVAVKEVKSTNVNEADIAIDLDKRVSSISSNESSKASKVDKREALKSKVETSQQKEVNATNSNESSKASKVNKREAQKQKVPKTEKESQVKSDEQAQVKPKEQKEQQKRPKKQKNKPKEEKKESHTILNDTIMPASFVSMQDDENEYDVSSYLADYDEGEEDTDDAKNISEIAKIVSSEINELFDLTCFNIETIDVSVHDENTLLVEFKGKDAALLIGKEGYRYKALSYMIFNWLNTKYQVQLRLEIAEFLKNQEESISKYLVGVCENINKDGRAQTKILDGVLVQIALNELRDRYPDKYIVIRSTRDGLKYIIVNDYHSN